MTDMWALAAAVEVVADLDEPDAGRIGVVVARPHPSGWFLSAHHRRDLPPEQAAHFAEFARVRCYLLLTQGPTAQTWQPGAGVDDWVAWSVADDVAATPLPDAVPAHWG